MAKHQDNFTSLLAATLSTIVHQLLHSRAIYPPESFVIHRYLGVRCHASRVPAVGQYIDDFLSVAVPSIVAGIGEAIVMVVMEEEIIDDGKKVAMKILERFEFAFEMDGTIHQKMDNTSIAQSRQEDYGDDQEANEKSEASRLDALDAQIVNEARTQLEYSFKQCLLGVIALERRKKRVGEKPENLSFKLCMRTVECSANGDDDQTVSWNNCQQLMRAVNSGYWREPDESSCLVTGGRNEQTDKTKSRSGLYRLIKDISLNNCGMSMRLGMDVS